MRAKSWPHPVALRNNCSRLSSKPSNVQRSPTDVPPPMNSVHISVLPVPVAPETRMTESRKKPPPHSPSRSELPEVMRTLDDFWVSSIADSGMTTMPEPASTVNGNSPFW